MVLELARRGAFDRPVAGVVDARCDLVPEQLPTDVEELEREDADVPELVEQSSGVLLGLRLRRIQGGRPRSAQDPVLVDVLDERPETRLAVAPAHGEQRELAVERDTFLQDVSGDSPRTGLHQTLALSVVAENPWFQEGREGLDLVVDPRGGKPELSEEPLFHKPVLCDFERAGRRDRAHPPRCVDGHVLELVGDGVGAVGEPIEQDRVVVGADEQLSHCARWRVRGRVEEAEREPERDPGQREHPPQLAPSDHADDGQVTVCYLAGSG